jgi:hypothetical protein
MRFVPEERRHEGVPCRFIPLSARGKTIDYYSRCGTQLELEEALGEWLRDEIYKIEIEPGATRNPQQEKKRKKFVGSQGLRAGAWWFIRGMRRDYRLGRDRGPISSRRFAVREDLESRSD